MNKNDVDFETWFDTLKVAVLEASGVSFRDADSVKDEYKAGKDAFDVAREIAEEYSDNDVKMKLRDYSYLLWKGKRKADGDTKPLSGN